MSSVMNALVILFLTLQPACVSGFVLVAHGTAQDCTTTMLQDMRKCYSDQNLDITISSQTDIQKILPSDISEYCRRQEAWKKAVACVQNTAKRCHEQMSLPTEIFPTLDKYTQGITFLCCNLADINPSCIINQYSGLENCIFTGVTAAVHGITPSRDIDKYRLAVACSGVRVGYDCIKQNIGTCGTKAKDRLLEYYNEYGRPAICENLDPAGDDYRRTGISPECNSGAVPSFDLAPLLAVMMAPLLNLFAAF